MVICEYCGKKAEASQDTCPSCGAPLPAESVQETVTQTSSPDTSTVSDATVTAAALIGALAASGAARRRELPPQPHPKELPPGRPETGPGGPMHKRPSGPMDRNAPGGHPKRR